MLIIVAVVFQLEDQWVPGGLVLHPAEERGWPVEIGAGAELATGAYHHLTRVEARTQVSEGVLHIATPADIAPAQPQRPVQVARALAAYQILAGEQAGTGQVADACRDFRQQRRLLVQAHLHVDALVLVGLTHSRAIGDIADVRIAEAGLEPAQGLQVEVQPGIGGRLTQADVGGAGRCHTGGRGLQQPHPAPVPGGGFQVARSFTPQYRAHYAARNHGFRKRVAVIGRRALGGQDAGELLQDATVPWQRVDHDPRTRRGRILLLLVPIGDAAMLHDSIRLHDPGLGEAGSPAAAHIIQRVCAWRMTHLAQAAIACQDAHGKRTHRQEYPLPGLQQRVERRMDFQPARIGLAQHDPPGDGQIVHESDQCRSLRQGNSRCEVAVLQAHEQGRLHTALQGFFFRQ